MNTSLDKVEKELKELKKLIEDLMKLYK